MLANFINITDLHHKQARLVPVLIETFLELVYFLGLSKHSVNNYWKKLHEFLMCSNSTIGNS